MAQSKYAKLIKPLKRSQKVRLRKELEKRKKENNTMLDDGDQWNCNWSDIKDKF